ncbi:hypothetical protein PG996_004152 [Apiospora saccharicola]|uniref:Uncharacterized protein n=1 Tax=Apiospora saccharicola TaxID=335842 RepID=A0ABR1W3H3_9PEZI
MGEQAADLDMQLVSATGNDAVALAESERTIALLEEDAVAELIVNEMALTAEMEMVGLALGSFFWEITASVAFIVAVYAATDMLWKVYTQPKEMDIYEPTRTYDASTTATTTSTPSSCPTDPLPCIGDRCQGSPDGTCSGTDFPGCPCNVSGSSIGDITLWGAHFDDAEDLIWSFQIPKPNVPVCVADSTDDVVPLDTSEWDM